MIDGAKPLANAGKSSQAVTVDAKDKSVRVRIRDGWDEAGREGVMLNEAEAGGLIWATVLWDGEEDPDCFKRRGLEVIHAASEAPADDLGHAWGTIGDIAMCKRCGYLPGGPRSKQPCKGGQVSLREAPADDAGACLADVVDIPIKAAQRVAHAYGYEQVVIIGRRTGQGGREHVTTYGVNAEHCRVAAHCGNYLKHTIMGWPTDDA
jgi:hypothetical protein